MKGKARGKGGTHQTKGKQEGVTLGRECKGVQLAKQNSVVHEGVEAGMHGIKYDLSKRKVITKMRAPSNVRKTSSFDAKEADAKRI